MNTTQKPARKIKKVVFSHTEDIFEAVLNEWQAVITWSTGETQTVYRNHMPNIDDPKMKAAGLVYTGRKNDQYTWKAKYVPAS